VVLLLSLHPAGSGGISTISGVVNISNDLNVDGHTNLDNVSIAGFTTITQDLDVDGHTNLDNVSIAGITTFANNINLGDNDKINLGDNEDFVINHNGQTYLKNTSGNFHLRTTNNTILRLQTGNGANGDDNAINCNPDSSVQLYYDGNLKLETTNTGAVVTGILTATSFEGDGSGLTGVNANVGITTNLSGTFTASAGSPSTINTFGYGSGDLVVEYTIYIKNGSDFQTQKLLAMRDGTTIHSTQFAVMFSSSLLVQCDATISSGNILLRATPETGVSGSTTYKIKREVM